VSLPSFATQTVTVLRPEWVSNHGTVVADWSAASEHTVTGCSLQPITGAEQPINRDAVTTTWQLYAPAGTDLDATDRVRSEDGHIYEVVGPIRVWSNGVLDHVDAVLSRVEG
jgi:hypothetical protein